MAPINNLKKEIIYIQIFMCNLVSHNISTSNSALYHSKKKNSVLGRTGRSFKPYVVVHDPQEYAVRPRLRDVDGVVAFPEQSPADRSIKKRKWCHLLHIRNVDLL